MKQCTNIIAQANTTMDNAAEPITMLHVQTRLGELQVEVLSPPEMVREFYPENQI
jgi:hypothetical protein